MEKEKNMLHLLDEEETSEKSPIEPQPESKEPPRKKSVLIVLSVLFVFLILTGAISQMFSVSKPEKKKAPEAAMDFEKYRRGRLTGDIRSAMNTPEKDVEFKEKPVESKKVRSKIPVFGKNAQKDAEILKKYADAVDPAADGAVVESGSRVGRRHFVPGGTSQKGGVYFRGKKDSTERPEKGFKLHNTKVKVKLEFSIRSTAASTVIAVVKNDTEQIPAGAKFYGKASGYVNKRTQIRFTKLVIGQNEYQVKGFAISGRDPGIESEVTDISSNNIDSSIKQGLVKTASGVAQRYAGVAGSVAGSAASNTVAPASQEMNRQQEANKMTQEYRVPAGTSFYIYLE
jgi:hypothetical protein